MRLYTTAFQVPIACVVSPLRRSRQFKGPRRTQHDLVGIAGLAPCGVQGVGQVANTERDPHLVDARPRQIPARDIDERIEVGRGVGVHGREVVLEQVAVADMTHRAADLDWPTPVAEAVGGAGIDDDGRNVRRRVAAPRYAVEIEIGVAGLGQRNVAPELEIIDRAYRAGQFDAPGLDLARKRRCRIVDLHVNIVPLDVIGGEGPLRSSAPQQLLDAGLVDTGTGQRQRRSRGYREDCGYRRIVGGRIHAVENQIVNRLEAVSGAIRHRLPGRGERLAGGNGAVEVDAVPRQRKIIQPDAADQREHRGHLETVLDRYGDSIEAAVSNIRLRHAVEAGSRVEHGNRVVWIRIRVPFLSEGDVVPAHLKLAGETVRHAEE